MKVPALLPCSHHKLTPSGEYLTLGKITESMHLNLRSKDAHAMRACAKADESWLAIKRRQTRKGKQNRQKHRYECARPRRKSCLVLRVWGGGLCAAGPVRENDTYCKRSIRVVSMFRCAGAKCLEGAGGAGGETGGSWYQRDVATCVFTWSGTSSPISLLWIHIFCSSRRFSAWQLIHS